MADYQRWYQAGSASVENGATAVTGALTAWLGNARPGDIFISGNYFAEIASVGNNTGLTLGGPWQGPTLDADSYAIARVSPAWELASDLAVRIAALAEACSPAPASNVFANSTPSWRILPLRRGALMQTSMSFATRSTPSATASWSRRRPACSA